MRYADLKAQTAKLTVGRHLIYETEPDAVVIENVGQRNPALPNWSIYRLLVRWNSRDLTPRHSDLLNDLLLKIEARPDLRLPILEACEQICAGADPLRLVEQEQLPRYFREPNETEWSRQTTIAQTAGLPTELLLCALQGLILVQDHNEPKMNAAEILRQAFSRIKSGESKSELVRLFAPRTLLGKRYYDLSVRT